MSQEYVDQFLSKAREAEGTKDKIAFIFDLFTKLWFTLLLPALVGIGTSVYLSRGSNENSVLSAQDYALIFAGIIFIVIHIILTVITIFKTNAINSTYPFAVEVKERHVEKIQELTRVRASSRHFAQLTMTQLATIDLVTFVVNRAIGEINTIRQKGDKISSDKFWEISEIHINQMIAPLVNQREHLFDYKSESKYNIALYFYSSLDDVLFVVARDCDSRLGRRNRRWKPGIGHVGLSFLYKSPMFCPNIEESNEISGTCSQGDLQNYRSFASFPILRCDDDGDLANGHKAQGVLVLTSALKEQFQQERDKVFLAVISRLMGIYLTSVETLFEMGTIEVGNKDKQ